MRSNKKIVLALGDNIYVLVHHGHYSLAVCLVLVQTQLKSLFPPFFFWGKLINEYGLLTLQVFAVKMAGSYFLLTEDYSET